LLRYARCRVHAKIDHSPLARGVLNIHSRPSFSMVSCVAIPISFRLYLV
jgi:hypothetical protein